jgi:hypothetical protein
METDERPPPNRPEHGDLELDWTTSRDLDDLLEPVGVAPGRGFHRRRRVGTIVALALSGVLAAGVFYALFWGGASSGSTNLSGSAAPTTVPSSSTVSIPFHPVPAPWTPPTTAKPKKHKAKAKAKAKPKAKPKPTTTTTAKPKPATTTTTLPWWKRFPIPSITTSTTTP